MSQLTSSKQEEGDAIDASLDTTPLSEDSLIKA
jgi:hypothetical protein